MTTNAGTRSFPVPGPAKGLNPLWIILALVAAALIGVIAFWLGTRNPSQEAAMQSLVTPMDQSIRDRTLAGLPLTAEQQESLRRATGMPEPLNPGVGQSQQGAAPKPADPAPLAVPAVQEWPIKGKWTVQTTQGPLTIIYRETDSARGKIWFLVDTAQKVIIIKNLIGTSLSVTTFGKTNGQIERTNDILAAGGEVRLNIVPKSGTVEIWFEISG